MGQLTGISRRQHQRAAVCCSLLLAITLSLGACAGSPPAYEPTGDELYDRFAALVLTELERHDYHALCREYHNMATLHLMREWKHDPPLLDFSAIRGWEGDFADDPRYWQLRAATGVDRLSVAGGLDGAMQADFSSPVFAAIDAGISNPGSFAVLPFEHMTLEPRHEEQLFRYLDAAVASDADNAHWYYRRALLAIELGAVQQAWDDISAGNAAPRNEFVHAFPFSALYDPAYDSFYRGNMVVDGVIRMLMDEEYGVGQVIHLKEHYNIGCVCLALGMPVEFADDMLGMAGRMGQAEHAPLPIAAISGTLAKILLNYCAENMMSLTPDQQAELEEITAACTVDIDAVKLARPVFLLEEAPEVDQTPYLCAFFYFGNDSLPNILQRFMAVPDRTVTDWVNFAWLARYERELAESYSAQLEIPAPPIITRWRGDPAE